MKYQLSEINIKELNPHPRQPEFSSITGEEWTVYVSSIENVGIIQPIVVGLFKDKANPEQGYIIVSGHHRYQAALQLKHKTIACLIRQYNDRQALDDAFYLSNQGRTLTFADKYVMYQHIAATEKDMRTCRERGGAGQFAPSAQHGQNGEEGKRGRILAALPEVTKQDYSIFLALEKLSPVERHKILALSGTKKDMLQQVRNLKDQRKELKHVRAELQARASKTAQLAKKEQLLANRERATYGTIEADQALKALTRAADTMRQAASAAHECIYAAPVNGEKLLDYSVEGQKEIREYIETIESAVGMFLADMKDVYSPLFEAEAKRQAKTKTEELIDKA